MQAYTSTSHAELKEMFWIGFRGDLLVLNKKDTIIVGLSGGSSLDIFYEEMGLRFSEIPPDVRKKIRWCFLDERVVSIDHIDRNEHQLREKFLNTLIEQSFIIVSQILSVDIDTSDIAGNYSRKIPHIDIALFGVGPDGHIASLFPYHGLLDSREIGYLEITDSPKPPSHRITVSPTMIRDIGYIFIAFMKGKEKAYRNFYDGKMSSEECPAKIMKEARSITIMSDMKN